MVILTSDDISRFWTKVSKRDSASCWEWQGSRVKETKWRGWGYGVYWHRSTRTTHPAHRISWMIENGVKIPVGKCICHHCDNPPCVNPSHLFLGDNDINATDRQRKQRQARGARHGRAKLTEQQVKDIRANVSRLSGLKLADLYGMSPSSIADIRHKRNWKHIV